MFAYTSSRYRNMFQHRPFPTTPAWLPPQPRQVQVVASTRWERTDLAESADLEFRGRVERWREVRAAQSERRRQRRRNKRRQYAY